MNLSNKKSVVIALLTSIVVVIGVIYIAGVQIFRKSNDCSDFKIDSQTWKSIDANTRGGIYSQSPRQKQARKIVRCRSLIGLSKRDVRGLLGAPDPVFTTSKSWAYNLFSIEDAYLTVDFNSKNKVKSVKATEG